MNIKLIDLLNKFKYFFTILGGIFVVTVYWLAEKDFMLIEEEPLEIEFRDKYNLSRSLGSYVKVTEACTSQISLYTTRDSSKRQVFAVVDCNLPFSNTYLFTKITNSGFTTFEEKLELAETEDFSLFTGRL